MRTIAPLLVIASVVVSCEARKETTAGQAPTVRLGYFANLTHAPAVVGVEAGLFAEALGPAARLETRIFNAGPEVIEAMFSGALDVAYIGPNPAINAFAKSDGKAIRIIAGATSGGAALVVRPGITTPAELKGKKLATPQRGNTQDVALRAWLRDQGLTATLEGAGDDSILPQPNAQSFETFRAHQIDGAWLPEPWATRLVLEGGGRVLVDERTLWPDGKFVTTHLIARTAFLQAHPELVKGLLTAHVRAIDLLTGDAGKAQGLVNAGLAKLTGRALPPDVLRGAWANLAFTVDPLPASLKRSAEEANKVGLLGAVALDGIYQLDLLDDVLGALGKPKLTVVTR
jgi:NitT/TauT family transport system substrate-binding protein